MPLPKFIGLHPGFAQATAIWPIGRSRLMNDFVGFRLLVPQLSGSVILRLAASSLYRVTVNGRFIAHGPIRAAHGWFRVDEITLTPHLTQPCNVIAVEVAGYNCNSFYLLDQPAFLQAELLLANQVVAATGQGDDWQAVGLKHRRHRVERYSYQRCFSESYQMRSADDAWKTSTTPLSEVLRCEPVTTGRFLYRRVAYPDYPCIDLHRAANLGRLTYNPLPPQNLRHHRALRVTDPSWKQFPIAELEIIPSLELQHYTQHWREPDPLGQALPLTLTACDSALFDLNHNNGGFIRVALTVHQTSVLALIFDEVLTAQGIDLIRSGAANIIHYQLQPGRYELESFEPYSLRYLGVLLLSGSCQCHGVGLRMYSNPQPGPMRLDTNDTALSDIFEAALQTYRQNSVDLYTDCPSRERAAWLCDSYFMAKAEYALTGSTRVEEAFLENYLLYEPDGALPRGMLPMCYPADPLAGQFIPQWPLWLILQLCEYRLERGGQQSLVDAFEPKIDALLHFYEQHTNHVGLLQQLPGWNFIEWSHANQLCQGIHYPTNMLWSAALESVAHLYARPALFNRVNALRQAILQRSFNGQFFVDNFDPDRHPPAPPQSSEVCQYYAFTFGLASPESHPPLWRFLLEEAGPGKDTQPKLHSASALMGYPMRFALMAKYEVYEQLQREIRDFYLPMAQQTGTLWEHPHTGASCNHGFAAVVAVWLLNAGRSKPVTQAQTPG